jgi:hypothetical protein
MGPRTQNFNKLDYYILPLNAIWVKTRLLLELLTKSLKYAIFVLLYL